MQNVLIVIHLMIVLALVVVVLMQRSEGGALGIGGGGGFMAGRSKANPLTRLTSVLAAGFFATSITLTILAGYGGGSVFDRLQPNAATPQPAAAPGGVQAPLGSGQGGILPALQRTGQQPGAGAPPSPDAGGAPQPAGSPGQPPSPDAGAPASGDANTPPADRTAPNAPQTPGEAPVTPTPGDPAAATDVEQPKQAPAQETSPQSRTTPGSAGDQPQGQPELGK